MNAMVIAPRRPTKEELERRIRGSRSRIVPTLTLSRVIGGWKRLKQMLEIGINVRRNE